jgi:hypothetical protein
MAYSSAVALTIQEITRAGLVATKNLVTPTATHGNKFLNDGKTFLYAVNGSAAPVTLTFDTPGSVDGQALADLVITLAATGDADGLDKKLIGPFTAIFNQTDGYVWVVTSLITTVTMGAFRLQNP